MAITFFGEAVSPADNAAQTGATVSITPPVLMLAGDLVVVLDQRRLQSKDLDVSERGGQCWSQSQALFPTQPTAQTVKVLWCQFNGKWDTDPSFVDRLGGAQTHSVHMLVFRPSSPAKFFILDRQTREVKAAATTFTITGHTTTRPSTVSVAWFASGAANTWGTLTGSGWSQTGLTAQQRNTGGTGQSNAAAYNIQTSAVALANVALTQSASTAGIGYIFSFAEVDLPFGGSGTQGQFVQKAHHDDGATSTTTQAATFGAAVGSGHLVWGFCHAETTTNAYPLTVLDNQGNEYFVIATSTYDVLGQSSWLFWCPNITNAPTTVTVTWSASCIFNGISIVETQGSYAFDKAAIKVWISADNFSPDVDKTNGLVPARDGSYFIGSCARTGSPEVHTGDEFAAVLPWVARDVGDGDSSSDASVRILCDYLQTTAAYLELQVQADFGLQDILIEAVFFKAGPLITKQPSDLNVVVGAAAVFSVEAVALSGSLSYQWKFNGSNVGSDSATYTRSSTTSSDQRGLVTVDVTDAAGTIASATATLTLSWDDVYMYAMPEDADPDDVRLRDPTAFEIVSGSIRGMPFGNRSTAFNGGRTFVGPIN